MKTVYFAIWRYIKQTDVLLIFITLIAAVSGFILDYSAAHGSSRTILVQICGLVVGLVIMVVISKIDYHDIAELWKYIAAACILLFILTLILGKSRAGSQDRSWIWIGSFTIQPAEFIKVAFVITFAKHYDIVKENIDSPRNIFLLFLHGVIPVCLLILQKDMGMMLVFLLMLVFMMYVANIKLRYFALAGTTALVSAPLLWSKVLGATQRDRILSLFNPIKYATDAYQQTQGTKAIGAGELLGYGLFHGPITQGPASFLPEKQNDMIFAVAGEELGFLGCIIILAIFVVLFFELIQDSKKSKDSMGSMICFGVFASFAIQMSINIAAVLMVFPITGISLPFYSSGGSSIVACFMAIGVVLSVYMHRSNSLFSSPKQNK